MTKLNLSEHEQHCFDNAAYFTAVRGANPVNRTRKEFPTLAEARLYAAAYGDRRTMIYAVTPFDSFAHIENA